MNDALKGSHHALDPRHAEAHNNRGNLFVESGELNKALADFDKAITLNPRLPEVYYNRGFARRGNADDPRSHDRRRARFAPGRAHRTRRDARREQPPPSVRARDRPGAGRDRDIARWDRRRRRSARGALLLRMRRALAGQDRAPHLPALRKSAAAALAPVLARGGSGLAAGGA